MGGRTYVRAYVRTVDDVMANKTKISRIDGLPYFLNYGAPRASPNNCGFGKWTKTWQLRFNGEKCESMRITHSREKSTTDDSLGAALKDVEDFIDLEDLTWSEHISTIVI